jgi:glycosyltransferase involved in cell wall biosynthesis
LANKISKHSEIQDKRMMSNPSQTATKPATPTFASSPPPVTTEEDYFTRMASTLELAEQAIDASDQLEHGSLCSCQQPKKTSLTLSVIIPVYNERETVGEIVARVRSVGRHHEIILVDDFSIDGTRKILLDMAGDEDIRVLMHGYNRGKGAAIRTALLYAQGDVVIIQDADLEYNPDDYSRLLAPIEQGQADVVYGSRFLGHANQVRSRTHRLGNWLLTAASNLVTGQKLSDMETCYKVFRREVLAGIDLEQDRFGFEPEITAKISRQSHRIVEVPIRYQRRGYAEGKKIGIKDAITALWCIARYR